MEARVRGVKRTRDMQRQTAGAGTGFKDLEGLRVVLVLHLAWMLRVEIHHGHNGIRILGIDLYCCIISTVSGYSSLIAQEKKKKTRIPVYTGARCA